MRRWARTDLPSIRGVTGNSRQGGTAMRCDRLDPNGGAVMRLSLQVGSVAGGGGTAVPTAILKLRLNTASTGVKDVLRGHREVGLFRWRARCTLALLGWMRPSVISVEKPGRAKRRGCVANFRHDAPSLE